MASTNTNTLSEESFGKHTNGEDIQRFTLINQNNLQVKIITYGGIVTSLNVPDKNGRLIDVVLGFDNVEEYIANPFCFGSIVGRFANRIANGQFTLDGQSYKLAINRDPNHLHGGWKGFDKKVWKPSLDGDTLKLSYISADGEEGYPGELATVVSYRLTPENELEIQYEARTTKATPINLTNHSYFNLAGEGSGNIYDHEVSINADTYLPTDETLIPTGELCDVQGNLFDLRKPVLLGDQMKKLPGGGYDHNFCLQSGNEKKLAASVLYPQTGIYLEVYTTQPGVQFYTGNFIPELKGKGNSRYTKHSAFCLETQHYPDSVNHSNFPNCILHPDEFFRQTTWYKFTVKH